MKQFLTLMLLFAFCLKAHPQKFLPDANKDDKRVFNIILANAKKGDAESQFVIGVYYLERRIIEEDYTKAESFFKMAEKQGFIYSALYYKIGSLYEKLAMRPQLITKDYQTYYQFAIDYFKKAISDNVDREQRSAIAEHMISFDYRYNEERNNGLNLFDFKEDEPIIKLYIDASDFGSETASLMLGRYYLEKNNPSKGKYYYSKAAELGDYVAQKELGALYYLGIENVAQDYNKAFYYLKLACTNPDLFNEDLGTEAFDYESYFPGIMSKLAACYRYGRGVKINYEIADLWDLFCAYLTGMNSERIKTIDGIIMSIEENPEESLLNLLVKFQSVFKKSSTDDNGCKVLYLISKTISSKTIQERNDFIEELKIMANDNLTKPEIGLIYAFLSNVQITHKASEYENKYDNLNVTHQEVNRHMLLSFQRALLPY